jgi:serine protease Do
MTFGEVAERLRRSTVQVETGGFGSGVIVSAGGRIVTNGHVLRGKRGPIVHLWDGRVVEATVAKRHPRRDLAELNIEASHLPAIAFADSGGLRPGQLAIAVGNPLGFQGAASTGVVHAVGPVQGLGAEPWVQASVRLAPGNSGGPLADAEGRLIGINTMVANGGLGLAIPANSVRGFLDRPEPPRLGVSVQTVRLAPDRLGLLILEVEPGSRAAEASLLTGDILVGAGGRRFDVNGGLAEAMEDAGSGALRIEFLRGDERRRVREVTVRI